MSKAHPKIAIVCDWLLKGGAENVVYELHTMYPEAPVYTSYCSKEWRAKLFPAKVYTGYLQYWPFSMLRKFVPFLRNMWFSRLKLRGYDVVISVTGAEAKAVNVAGGRHISLVNAPTHYYWSRYQEYLHNPGFGVFNGLARLGLKLLVKPMRRWDYRAAQMPDVLVANSTHTQKQIKKYYGRESMVIHPPVEIEKFKSSAKPRGKRSGLVIVGRQTPYKRIDLAVAACSELKLPLTVIGTGPEHSRLRRMAGASVKFSDNVGSSEELAGIIGAAEGFIFPGIDDFGIAAVEALSAGTPVIAFRGGGAMDYIKPGRNGQFFYPQTVSALIKALKNFNPDKYTQGDIKKSANNFSIEAFRSKISKLVEDIQISRTI
ncbi:MAG TPA: glycosyltransferase [Candidatus Saccharimonadales bacterium]|nr:glycosyltransferase [Candidatus Saccharimonadales bacterium]